MAKKGKKAGPAEGVSEAPTSKIYDAAIGELKSLGDSDAARRKVESGPLREGRGQDVLRLHATLTAVDQAHQSLSGLVNGFQQEVNDQFGKTLSSLEEKFDKTWETTDSKFDKTWKATGDNFDKTWKTLNERFDKTWDTIGSNFEATNERTKREVHDLREEMTKILDKRFTQIDQTFASIRADIEVLKALQMELIKERIGRPEVLRR